MMLAVARLGIDEIEELAAVSDVGACTVNGDGALHFAVARRSDPTSLALRMVGEWGLSPLDKGSDGEDAMDLARKHQSPSLAEAMEMAWRERAAREERVVIGQAAEPADPLASKRTCRV